MSSNVDAKLDRIDSLLTALVMFQVQATLEPDGRSRKDPLSVEGVLYQAGFAQAEIVKLVNKSKQTVSAKLKSEGLT